MPVGEMLRRIDSAELTEWIAYFRLQEAPKKSTAETLKAQFGHRVIHGGVK
jgi:hypothetical protein